LNTGRLTKYSTASGLAVGTAERNSTYIMLPGKPWFTDPADACRPNVTIVVAGTTAPTPQVELPIYDEDHISQHDKTAFALLVQQE
jgi:hypothetical protein